MFDWLYTWKKQRKLNHSDAEKRGAREGSQLDPRCAIGQHDLNDPSPRNWLACGAIVTTQKRFTRCQRTGCGYQKIQVRQRFQIKWQSPFGPWTDIDVSDLDPDPVKKIKLRSIPFM